MTAFRPSEGALAPVLKGGFSLRGLKAARALSFAECGGSVDIKGPTGPVDKKNIINQALLCARAGLLLFIIYLLLIYSRGYRYA